MIPFAPLATRALQLLARKRWTRVALCGALLQDRRRCVLGRCFLLAEDLHHALEALVDTVVKALPGVRRPRLDAAEQLQERITAGEIDNVRAMVPAEIRKIWDGVKEPSAAG